MAGGDDCRVGADWGDRGPRIARPEVESTGSMRAVTAPPKRLVHALQRLVPHRGDQMLVLGVLTAILLAAGGTVAIVRSTPSAAAGTEQAFDVPSMTVAPSPTTTSTTPPTTTTTTAPAPVAPTALPASAHKGTPGGDVHPIVPATQI